jgi:predicted nucleic acid-binding protein
MTPVILDASAALAFLLAAQSTPAARSFLAESAEFEFLAPAIFTWEVTNVLQRHAIRGLSAGAFEQALIELAELQVTVEPPMLDAEVQVLARDAFSLELSVFDAAYLKLAVDQGAALASRDARLLSVALRHVKCFDLR